MAASFSHEEMRRQIERYVCGDATFREFADWFVTLPLNEIEHSGDEEARELMTELHLRLAEYGHGDWTEGELRALLQPLTQPGIVAVDMMVKQASAVDFQTNIANATYLSKDITVDPSPQSEQVRVERSHLVFA
ncbi:MAG: hypothetical protein M1396_04575 [Chloroflexi bacterium]|nr:hypothetical protein [Chloroflexota bacterium]